MNYRVVICSHKRPQKLFNLTLNLLIRNGIKPDIVDIYIHESEINYYSEFNDKWNLIAHKKKGLKDIRTWVSNQYKNGSKIVFMDDDIKNIVHFVDKKKYNKKDNNLVNLIKEGFEACEKNNCSLWGCCPYDNPFFGNQKISTNLKYIIQACCGVILNHKAEERSYTTIEDFERTIKYYLKDKKVVRINYYGIETKYYASGGLNEYRNFENKEKDIIDLCNKYPNLVSIRYKKTREKPSDVDIRFNYRHKF